MAQTARRYAGQSAEERDAQRRMRLLGACRDLVGERGYAGTTIERICSTAAVSTRHFYLQYDGKEACFTDLYESIVTASFEAALLSLEASMGLPLKRRAPAAFLAYLGPMVSDVRSARIAFVEIMGVSPRLEERRLALRSALADLVESEGRAAVARGEDIVDRDWRFAAIALAGAASSVIYDWTKQDQRCSVVELEAALSELASMLLTG